MRGTRNRDQASGQPRDCETATATETAHGDR